MNLLTKTNQFFLSSNSKKKIERIILYVALVGFFLHLSLIYLSKFGVIDFLPESDLLTNPISAIYTPFSFILIYEVYLLIYYLPKSYDLHYEAIWNNYANNNKKTIQRFVFARTFIGLVCNQRRLAVYLRSFGINYTVLFDLSISETRPICIKTKYE